MSEAETAQILKEAMRVFAFNSMSATELGIFEGIDKDGIIVKMQLRGTRLSITPVVTEPIKLISTSDEQKFSEFPEPTFKPKVSRRKKTEEAI